MVYHEFQVVGRKVPTEQDPNPKIYRMKIFAKSAILARSRFWHFIKATKKVKSTKGEILSCNEVFETSPTKVKNFGIFLRYDSRTGTTNIYKEYRDVSRTAAVTQLFNDMAGQYGVAAQNVQVISLDAIPASKTRRANTKQFHNASIKFPLPHQVPLKDRKYRATFKATRPRTHFY